MSGGSRASRSSYLDTEFAHSCLIVLLFWSVFVTVVLRHDIVDCVVYARCWTSPLWMVQSLQS